VAPGLSINVICDEREYGLERDATDIVFVLLADAAPLMVSGMFVFFNAPTDEQKVAVPGGAKAFVGSAQSIA